MKMRRILTLALTVAFAGLVGGKSSITPALAATCASPACPGAPYDGYWLAAADGWVGAYGKATLYGSMAGRRLASPIVGIAGRESFSGYWLAGADGGVFSFNAGFYGSMGGKALSAPIVGIASQEPNGYTLVGADGGVFTFGSDGFYGSLGGKVISAPIVGITVHPTRSGGAGLVDDGYWLLASDGAVYSFGGASYWGRYLKSSSGPRAVALLSTGDGKGYWILTADGGVHAFGDAMNDGSMAAKPLAAPMVSGAASVQTYCPGPGTQPPPGPDSYGYWLAGRDGGVFSFGDASYDGSGTGRSVPVVGMASSVDNSSCIGAAGK